jgi:hypothetical protein
MVSSPMQLFLAIDHDGKQLERNGVGHRRGEAERAPDRRAGR